MKTKTHYFVIVLLLQGYIIIYYCILLDARHHYVTMLDKMHGTMSVAAHAHTTHPCVTRIEHYSIELHVGTFYFKYLNKALGLYTY